jgi:hypothetical protein
MKRLRLIISTILTAGLFGINSFAQPSPVNTYLLDPAYPVVGQPVTIYINANHYGLTTDNGHLSAWTGLVTSASANLTEWRHNPISNWGDTSIILDHVADVNNDSVFQLVIPDISTFYPGVGSETVFRIAIIVRGQLNHAVSGQTDGGDFFEVFGADPTTAAVSYPSSATGTERMTIDFNIKAASDNRVANYIAAHPNDTLYVHSGINTNLGDWQHVLTQWSENLAKNRLLKVSDSIYRFYIDPTARSYYGVLAVESTSAINIIVRPKNGSIQTETYTIPVVSSMQIDMSLAVNGILSYPTYPTVNDHIFIFVNAKAYVRPTTGDTLNPASTLSTWSGLITSASADYRDDWTHQVNSAWTGLGDSVLLTRLNDTIQFWEIPSIASKYKVNTATENVFRIAFIARDTLNGGVNKQTDNLYFEIYGSVPTALVATQPAKAKEDGKVVYTFNINQSTNTTLKDYIGTSHNDSVGVYTAVNATWTHEVAPWVDVPTTAKLQTLSVNDSIFRFAIMTSIRDFYGVTDTCEHISQTNLVPRSDPDGNSKTEDIIVMIDTMATCKFGPVGIITVAEIGGISVYPNPVQDNLTFSFEKPENGSIEIFNIEGQKLYSMNITDQQSSVKVNVGTLNSTSSVLIYKVTTVSGSAFGKILVKK